MTNKEYTTIIPSWVKYVVIDFSGKINGFSDRPYTDERVGIWKAGSNVLWTQIGDTGACHPNWDNNIEEIE